MTNLYSVTYNTNNSTGGVTPPTQTAESNSDTYTFVAPLQNDLVRTGYVFAGWSLSPDSSTAEYKPGSTITLAKDSPSITLYAVWLSTTLTDWNTLQYMQQMNPSACANGTEAGKQLIDVRDGKSYWVAKLKDGNCWMTQNLDLDLQQGVALTPATSDVNSNWTPGDNEGTITTTLNSTNWPNTNNIIRSWDPALGGDLTYCNNGTTAGVCKTSGNPTTSVNDGYDAQGNYYSWCAATAGCRTKDGKDPAQNEDAASSICPKGWRLPSSNSSKGPTFAGLQTAYGIGQAGGNLLNSPLYFLYGGNVDSGKLNNAGSNGFYWSSTAYSGAHAYYLYFNSSTVNPSNYSARYLGVSVRCVAK